MRQAIETVRLLLVLACALIAATGCRNLDPAGPYKGDKVLYAADVTIENAYDVLHEFVKWEYQNRAALKKQPEIRKAANVVRANAERWINSAIAAREAYAISPTQENRDGLDRAIAVLRAALTEATGYLTTKPK